MVSLFLYRYRWVFSPSSAFKLSVCSPPPPPHRHFTSNTLSSIWFYARAISCFTVVPLKFPWWRWLHICILSRFFVAVSLSLLIILHCIVLFLHYLVIIIVTTTTNCYYNIKSLASVFHLWFGGFLCVSFNIFTIYICVCIFVYELYCIIMMLFFIFLYINVYVYVYSYIFIVMYMFL